jgi:hypothetical protein
VIRASYERDGWADRYKLRRDVGRPVRETARALRNHRRWADIYNRLKAELAFVDAGTPYGWSSTAL